MWREIRGGRAGARELLGDPAMQLLALARQDRRVHGLGQQRVAEPKRAGILVGDEDSLVDGLAERLTVFRTHQRRADVPSGGGDQPQEVSSSPLTRWSSTSRRLPGSSPAGREQLLGEEWIAARALRDRTRTPGVGEQRDHVLVRERGELEVSARSGAPRALDEPAQGLSMRAEQDDSLVSEVVREEDDQVERRRVGPVQVFEHQQHRIGVIGEPRQRGLEHTQLRAGLARERTERFDERLVRQLGADEIDRAADPDGESAVASARRDLGGEPRLADARLTRDEHSPAAPRLRRVEHALELFQLACAPDEHGASISLRGRPGAEIRIRAAQDKAHCPMRGAPFATRIGLPSRRQVMSAFRRLPCAVATALVVAAIAAPTAGARPIYDSPGTPVARSNGGGFDLGSAAVGAGGAGAFLVLTAAGIAFVGQRRHRVGVVS